MIREGLPDGKNPAENRAWWDSLTDKQRTDLERAVPVALHDMPGIPDEVKARLVGTDGKFDRVQLVRWAEEKWNDTDLNVFKNNCAHFVSSALEEAGLQHKPVPDGGDLMKAWEPDTTQGFLDGAFPVTTRDGSWRDGPNSYTATWSHAASQYTFMTNHGGVSVAPHNAMPGDLVYLQNATGAQGHPLHPAHRRAPQRQPEQPASAVRTG